MKNMYKKPETDEMELQASQCITTSLTVNKEEIPSGTIAGAPKMQMPD